MKLRLWICKIRQIILRGGYFPWPYTSSSLVIGFSVELLHFIEIPLAKSFKKLANIYPVKYNNILYNLCHMLLYFSIFPQFFQQKKKKRKYVFVAKKKFIPLLTKTCFHKKISKIISICYNNKIFYSNTIYTKVKFFYKKN